jgi:S-adenosylmethionine:tRNA ribosyltransferase-isomerase
VQPDLDLAAYDFDLPPEQIAQHPAPQRDGARMLVLHRDSGRLEDRSFRDLPEYIGPNDALVVNNTRVIPARLAGHRQPGGGRVEVFLVKRLALGQWEVLGRPGKKLAEGAVVDFPAGLSATVEQAREAGRRVVRFRLDGALFEVADAEERALEAVGRMPLPPYIAREAPEDADRERYQTVYAAPRGAVAAPTAGLHFTPETFEAVRARGAQVAEVTLHVGYGTFEPVRSEDLRHHAVAAEEIIVSEQTAEVVNAARASGGRVLAVGTTSVRTLESAAAPDGALRPVHGPTDLTILPGYAFRCVDALLTNFHLPRSSLLVLVSAFAGRGQVLDAYRHAVQRGYRFYSYGDCMLIV